jgi:hypothetical protein
MTRTPIQILPGASATADVVLGTLFAFESTAVPVDASSFPSVFQHS